MAVSTTVSTALGLGARSLAPAHALRRALPLALVSAAGLGWAGVFGWLAVLRHLAGGSHAEDLGWTDQVIDRFLAGQWFRMSIYQGAFWNTELTLDLIRRPDSLLAFHVEPMLLLFVPLYALGVSVSWLLVLQALAFGLGAVPAYRIGARVTRSRLAGAALSVAYLLSPLGQWAVLADVHTSTIAAPLLLLLIDLLLAHAPSWQVLVIAGLAASAREDVAPVIALLGLLVLSGTGLGLPRGWTAGLALSGQRTAGLALLVGGFAWTAACAMVIRAYSGGLSPFDVRYAGLRELGPLALLMRPVVTGYLGTLLLSGGWLALVAPLAMLPALPILLLNVLSTSDWMASGRAHYSALLVPFIVLGAALALARLAGRPRLLRSAAGALVLSSGAAYLSAGAGPLAANFAPASVSTHAEDAAGLAASLPTNAAVSATSSVVPHLSRRAHLYVFPAVLDADYILLDLDASPAPTSAGDVFLRVQSLLAEGGWEVDVARDGLLLLHRVPDAPPTSAADLGPGLFPVEPSVPAPGQGLTGLATFSLLEAELIPPADGAIDVDGPRWTLHTTWRTPPVPPPPGRQLHFLLDLGPAGMQDVWDLAPLWWNPPHTWPPGTTLSIDVPGVPVSTFRSWQAVFE